MEKHTKKIFGLFGLLLVAAMTIIAAVLPTPGAIAMTSSVTDSIVVRVIGAAPHVEFTEAADTEGKTLFTPTQSFPYIYDNSETVTITLEYTDEDGNTQTFTLETIDAGLAVGSGVLDLDLSGPDYGYGDYVVRIIGEKTGALPNEDSFSFSYYPFDATAKEDPDTGDANIELDYKDNTTIEYFTIVVRDEDGNIVDEIPEIRVDVPGKTGVVPFSESGVPGGNYTIEIIAHDSKGNTLTRTVSFTYTPTKVPDTGGLLSMLNISKADYLATGLIVFFLIGVGGAVYIVKSTRKNRR